MKRKLCIAGFASPSKMVANFKPNDVEIWGMNEGHMWLTRITVLFQLHPRDWREEWKREQGQESKIPPNTFGRGEGHVKFLQACPIPVIMQQHFDDIPNSFAFPLKEVEEKYGHYLTSTPAFMLAFALHLDDLFREGKNEPVCGMRPALLSEVHISGVELRVGTEQIRERPCFEYYLGRAIERGAKFVPPPMGTAILNAPFYAYEDAPRDTGTKKVYLNIKKEAPSASAGTADAKDGLQGGDTPPGEQPGGGVAWSDLQPVSGDSLVVGSETQA